VAKRGAPRTKTPEKFTAAQKRQIDEMAEAQCRDYTIAERLGVDLATFKAEFSKRCRQKRAEGKAKVMVAQYQGSLTRGKGAVTERIWWGKQHLEQSDKQEIEQKEPFRLILTNGRRSTKATHDRDD
jgi:hypothetical protein